MLKNDRDFLEEVLQLTVDAIREHREFIADGVSTRLPPEHPLRKIREKLADRLRLKNGITSETDQKIREAARLRVEGKTWNEVAQEIGNPLNTNDPGDSFVRDLKAGRRYHERFMLWLQAFTSIKK